MRLYSHHSDTYMYDPLVYTVVYTDWKPSSYVQLCIEEWLWSGAFGENATAP